MLTPEQQQAIATGIIEREGGLSHHAQDPGGLTKWGISQRAYPALDIASLSRAQAQAIYIKDYIRAFKLHELSNVQNAEILADAFVNGFPLKRLQRLLRVTPDGVIGPQTLRAMDEASAKQLLDWRLDWYVQLAGHPFLAGWVNRLRKLGF
jgi:lysozyme family protein